MKSILVLTGFLAYFLSGCALLFPKERPVLSNCQKYHKFYSKQERLKVETPPNFEYRDSLLLTYVLTQWLKVDTFHFREIYPKGFKPFLISRFFFT